MAEVWRDRFRVSVGRAVFILSPLRFGKLATAGIPAVRGTEINVRLGLSAETGVRSPDGPSWPNSKARTRANHVGFTLGTGHERR